MKTMKFGGSSVKDAEKIRNVASIVIAESEKTKVAVVLSAMKGITDNLLECADLAVQGNIAYKTILKDITEREFTAFDELIGKENESEARVSLSEMLEELKEILLGVQMVKECSVRSQDLIVSFGERMNNTVCAAYLRSVGIKATYVDTRKLILTDDNFGAARVNYKESYMRIREHLSSIEGIPVITGFIGATEDGITTTLGRNGSDFTASIIAGATGSEIVEIWTDVDGVLSADPRIVEDAFVIPELTYTDAMELSYFGAEVIHPYTMIPAVEKNIPIIIKNTMNPSAPGTVIAATIKPHSRPITGIASVKDTAIVNIEGSGMTGKPGIAGTVFTAMAEAGINIIMISQASSEHSICLVLKEAQAIKAVEILNEKLAVYIKNKRIEGVQIRKGLEIVAVIGESMIGTPGIAGKIFSALGEASVNILAIAQGSSERNISFVVDKADKNLALNTVHKAFL